MKPIDEARKAYRERFGRVALKVNRYPPNRLLSVLNDAISRGRSVLQMSEEYRQIVSSLFRASKPAAVYSGEPLTPDEAEYKRLYREHSELFHHVSEVGAVTDEQLDEANKQLDAMSSRLEELQHKFKAEVVRRLMRQLNQEYRYR